MKSLFYKPAIKYQSPNVVLKKGDILLIKFSKKASKFEVVTVNKALNVLKVKVIKDFYKEPFKTGSIIDIGKTIFEGYWAFSLKKK